MNNENEIKSERRELISKGVKMAVAGVGLSLAGTGIAAAKSSAAKNPYAEPEAYGLPRKGVEFDIKKAGLVVVDPQVDFLSPKGVAWEVMKDSIKDNNTVANLESLFKQAKAIDLPVFISPHYYYPYDHQWLFNAPGETFMHSTNMFERKGPLTITGFESSGADFMPEFKPYILDGKTVIASPHKIFGPETNDLVLQLRKRNISQILLAGMAANLCIESHMRELIEQGFEVVVIKDATAGPRIPEGDGYLAALTNYRIIANDLWTTEKTVSVLKKAG